MSIITIVDPTGVPANIEAKIPVTAPNTEITQEKIITFLKLLKSIIEEIAGNIIRAEIKRDPTRFIASTIITAITVARAIFIIRVLVPQA